MVEAELPTQVPSLLESTFHALAVWLRQMEHRPTHQRVASQSDPRSEHVPGLWIGSLVGVRVRGKQSMSFCFFLSHQHFSPPPSNINENLSAGEDKIIMMIIIIIITHKRKPSPLSALQFIHSA